MKNMAHRHHRAALKNKKVLGPVRKAYVIQDINHRPDLRGEFGGVKVLHASGKHLVHLTDKAARFYLDSGSIEPLVKEEVKAAEPVKEEVAK
jgi:hypothetical protein